MFIMKRPKLSSKEKVQVTPGGGTLRAHNEGVVQLSEKGAVFKLVRTIIGLFLAAVLVLFALYVALAATLMRAIPEWGDFPSFTWVKNATFVAGVPSPGTYAYVSGKGADNSLLGHLEQSFMGVEYGAVVEVVTGPYGTVTNGLNDRILVNDEDTGYVGVLPEQGKLLNNQYVAKCVEGECGEPGDIVIIGQNLLVGEAEFRYDKEHGIVRYKEGEGEQVHFPGLSDDSSDAPSRVDFGSLTENEGN